MEGALFIFEHQWAAVRRYDGRDIRLVGDMPICWP